MCRDYNIPQSHNDNPLKECHFVNVSDIKHEVSVSMPLLDAHVQGTVDKLKVSFPPYLSFRFGPHFSILTFVVAPMVSFVAVPLNVSMPGKLVVYWKVPWRNFFFSLICRLAFLSGMIMMMH
jgi:hypothetical protein